MEGRATGPSDSAREDDSNFALLMRRWQFTLSLHDRMCFVECRESVLENVLQPGIILTNMWCFDLFG
jgi:hypothetical protein